MPESDAVTPTPPEVHTTPEVTEHPISEGPPPTAPIHEGGMTMSGSQAQMLARLTDVAFELHRPEGGLLLSIDLSTGKLTEGEDYDAGDAADAFWTAVEQMAPDAPKFRKGERH
jgi:hypothetical protein